MTTIELQQVSKRLGDSRAVDNVSLEIASGELYFLLGPSGCGKTTLLNLIAGLLQPEAGRILFDGQDVTRVPTNARNAVMCFQSYALWPHLTLAQNVAFGLDVRRVGKAERQRRVEDALQLVEMSDYAQRRPAELSGGQQQRVAIARAIAVRPACLLLDEPLSNLDARLRQQMRGELRRICKTTGLTTVYVTHDQQEALSIADSIAIMKSGRVLQVGSPRELYERPQSAFVARFLGHAHVLEGTVLSVKVLSDDVLSAKGACAKCLMLKTPLGVVHARTNRENVADGQCLKLSLRPEQMEIVGGAQIGEAAELATNHFVARHLESSFLGSSSEHLLEVEGTALRIQCSPPRFDLPPFVSLHLPEKHLVVLPE